MKIYVSGRIKDYPRHEEHFRWAVKKIAERGHVPMSPLDNGLPASASYEEHMREDLRMLLDCDAIYMLEGWESSGGARAELAVAAVCGLPVYHEKFQTLPRP